MKRKGPVGLRNTPEFQEKVQSLLEQGYCGKQVAEMLNTSYTTVQRTAKLLGRPLTAYNRKYDETPSQQWEKIHTMLEGTSMTTAEIAMEMGIELQRIHQLAYYNGYLIKRRNARVAGENAPDPDSGIRRITSNQKKGYEEPTRINQEPVKITTTNQLNRIWKPARI